MAEPDPALFVTQAAFARLRKVARKTVSKWKCQGHLVFDASGLVDVAQTNDRLNARARCYRLPVTKSSSEEPGNTETVLLPGRAAALAASMRADLPGTRRRITERDRATILAALDAASGEASDDAARLRDRLRTAHAVLDPAGAFDRPAPAAA